MEWRSSTTRVGDRRAVARGCRFLGEPSGAFPVRVRGVFGGTDKGFPRFPRWGFPDGGAFLREPMGLPLFSSVLYTLAVQEFPRLDPVTAACVFDAVAPRTGWFSLASQYACRTRCKSHEGP